LEVSADGIVAEEVVLELVFVHLAAGASHPQPAVSP
jgi:hypothetical protein